jgi:toxin ParE1/3/4
MRLVVTDDARRDLHELDRYMRQRWGAAQADEYRWLIIESFARLLDRPTRGRGVDHLVPGLRRLNVRRHAVFYFVRGDHLVIARILHQNMDIGARLGGADD